MAPAMAVLLAAGVGEWETEPETGAARWMRRIAGAGTLLVAAAISVSPHIPWVRDSAGASLLEDAAPAFSGLAGFLGLAGVLALGRLPAGFVAAGAAAMLSLLVTVRGLVPVPVLGLDEAPLLDDVESELCGRDMVEARRTAGMTDADRLFDATNHVTGVLWYADRTSETKPDGTAPDEMWVVDAFAAGQRTFAILEHEIAEKGPRGEETQWQRILKRIPAEAPRPRILWRGMGRVVVTNAKR